MLRLWATGDGSCVATYPVENYDRSVTVMYLAFGVDGKSLVFIYGEDSGIVVIQLQCIHGIIRIDRKGR